MSAPIVAAPYTISRMPKARRGRPTPQVALTAEQHAAAKAKRKAARAARKRARK